MSKNLLQDIIKVKYVKKEKEEVPQRIERPESRIFSRPKFSEPEFTEEEDNKKPRYSLWIVALVSIVFLFFAISFLFSGAKITINPKTKDISLNQNFSAVKDSNNSDTLSFDLVAISGEENKIVQVDEEKDLLVKAEGIVVIYNAFNSSSQTLDIDTRLEGSNGKIYKTKEKIKVPGMTKDGKPGSVEVGIYGVEAGEEYNSTPLDFKIFGFKGSSKYDKFYARSKGEIIGGIIGKFYQISDTEKVAVVNELKDTLKTKLLEKINDQIPNGFVLFKDAVFLNINNENQSFVSKDNQVPVNIKGTLYGFLFNGEKLTKKIIETDVEDYDGSDVYISNLSNLIFSISGGEIASFKDVKNIDFNLSGTAKIVWNFDGEKLITDLLGKKKKDFNQILTLYSNIESADLVIKPAWKNSFPDKSKDIKIIVNYPN
ncbi:MAG: hypothetical protein WC264_01185 [Candidatus Paceibacterota bacterium]|jgi:hypothetical protein